MQIFNLETMFHGRKVGGSSPPVYFFVKVIDLIEKVDRKYVSYCWSLDQKSEIPKPRPGACKRMKKRTERWIGITIG